jgi:RNA polymerase sigma-70 factor (ECF subfamily)
MKGSDAHHPGDPDAKSSTTSRGLLEQVKVADQAAWQRLIDLYGPLVYRWCRRWELPEQDAADVFQDVFQAVAKNIGGFRKENAGDTFRGWLRTITHNKVRDFYRKSGRQPAGEGGTDAQIRLQAVPAASAPEEDDSGVAQADRGLFSRALALIQGEFEPHTWQAFWLTAVEGRAAVDVSSELGMSPGAVRVAKARVLRRLRVELRDDFRI